MKNLTSVSEMYKSLATNIRTEKQKQVLEKQLGITIDINKSDVDLV